jgi:hypothetical protein
VAKQNEQAVATALGIQGGYRWSISTLWDEYQISFEALPNIHYHDKVLIGQAAKNPTCTESGNIGYFICISCGAWFKNWNGTEEIFDKDSVKIPALEHTYNKQLQDEFEHWKVCSGCGLEQMNSRGFHYDNNKNGKCDVCNAEVEVPTEPPTQPPTTLPTTPPTTPPTQAPTENPTTPPTQAPTENPTTSPSEEPTMKPTEEPTTEQGSASTGESSQQPTDKPTTTPTEDGNTEPSEGETEPPMPSSGATTLPSEPSEGSRPVGTETFPGAAQPRNDPMPLMIAGAIAGVAAIVTIIILLIKKKK